MTGCKYISISDDGLLIEREGKQEHVDVDTVILCAGQESNNKLFDELKDSNSLNVFKIGGAEMAGELDAKRAIDQGSRLAAQIESSSTGEVFNQPIPASKKIFDFVQSVVKK